MGWCEGGIRRGWGVWLGEPRWCEREPQKAACACKAFPLQALLWAGFSLFSTYPGGLARGVLSVPILIVSVTHIRSLKSSPEATTGQPAPKTKEMVLLKPPCTCGMAWDKSSDKSPLPGWAPKGKWRSAASADCIGTAEVPRTFAAPTGHLSAAGLTLLQGVWEEAARKRALAWRMAHNLERRCPPPPSPWP